MQGKTAGGILISLFYMYLAFFFFFVLGLLPGPEQAPYPPETTSIHTNLFVFLSPSSLPPCFCSIVSVGALIIRHYRTAAVQATTTQMLPKPEGNFHNA
jgi:hypothetical protein